MDPITTNSTWADPGAAVDLPRASRSSVSIDLSIGSDGESSGSRPLPGSPVDRLQPRTVGQLLDAGFEVVKFRGRTIATLAAIIILPLYALPAVLSARVIGNAAKSPVSLLSGPNGLLTSTGSPSGNYWRLVIYGLVAQGGLMIARMLLGVAITHLTTSWMVGNDPTVRETLRHVGRRSLVAIVAWAVLLPVKAVSAVACYIGLLYTLPVFAILAPVVSVERAGPFASIRRTHGLALRRYGPFLGMWALWLVATGAMQVSSQAVVALLRYLASDTSWGWIVTASFTTIFTAILATVEVAVWAMAYIDVRIRTEGIDIAFEVIEEFERAGA